MAKSTLDWIALILLIIGGLNWGLAILNINLVTSLFGTWPIIVQIIYGLVGLAALYTIYYLFK
jgi:uncharacterized protein